MFVLGLESTCDETACAVVKDGNTILSNVIYSQCEIHSQFGGVFPELACRRHVDALIPTIQEALSQAQITSKDIELIAVAKGPGLIGALLIGLNAAKALSMAWQIPFVGVNHVEAHLYAAMMPILAPNSSSVSNDPMEKLLSLFPALGIVISGGHTFLVKIMDIGSYIPIGSTQDDAVGEAFDKVASMLNLPYPGGPEIEELAKKGKASRFSFRPSKVKGHPWDFSFSGLKTSVLYAIKGVNPLKNSPLMISEDEKADVAAAFQETALGDVVDKALKAAEAFGCKTIFCGGGVSNSTRLKEIFKEQNQAHLPLFFPPPKLTMDNAAMIAGLGYHLFMRKKEGDAYDLEPNSSRKCLLGNS